MTTLQNLIKQTIKGRYVKEYQAHVKESEALGVMIAAYFKWDGVRILDAFQSALEDANFHTLNADIEALRERHELQGDNHA